MSKLLLLSVILFICSWQCCRFGSQPHASQAVSKTVAASGVRAETFSFEEDGALNPYEELGAFLLFVAFSIPLVIVLTKALEKAEVGKSRR